MKWTRDIKIPFLTAFFKAWAEDLEIPDDDKTWESEKIERDERQRNGAEDE